VTGTIDDIARGARLALAELREAEDFGAAKLVLSRFAGAIGMPRMAWAPDVARPYFDPDMDSFMREQGWPEELISMWWSRNAMLKMPYYIRCRFEHLPFLTTLKTSRRETARHGELKEQRIAVEMSAAMGLRALITVPIHLPKGRVAMLTWATTADPAEAEQLCRAVEIELLAAGHFFMRAYLRTHGQRGVTEEEIARLTPREWDCLRLTAQGYKEAEVGGLAGIAPTTVRYHLDNVVAKLGATNRTHAAALAAQLGLLGPIAS
jgi:DNA-binding CsgD family transcriptional regulator